MKTEITLVRHGETKWNNMRRYQGVKNIELNEKGYAQARLLKDFLNDKKIDCIYTSDLNRARDTAEIISEPHNVEIFNVEGLREINFGKWEGMNYKEIERDYPQLFRKWKNNPTSVSPPEGEMVAEFQKRVVKSFKGILCTEKEDRKIVVVSHGGVIRVLLAYYLKMPLEYFWRIDINNVSVSKIIFFDGAPIIKSVNCTAHLEN